MSPSTTESRDDKVGRLAALIATRGSRFNELKLAGEADVSIDIEEEDGGTNGRAATRGKKRAAGFPIEEPNVPKRRGAIDRAPDGDSQRPVVKLPPTQPIQPISWAARVSSHPAPRAVPQPITQTQNWQEHFGRLFAKDPKGPAPALAVAPLSQRRSKRKMTEINIAELSMTKPVCCTCSNGCNDSCHCAQSGGSCGSRCSCEWFHACRRRQDIFIELFGFAIDIVLNPCFNTMFSPVERSASPNNTPAPLLDESVRHALSKSGWQTTRAREELSTLREHLREKVMSGETHGIRSPHTTFETFKERDARLKDWSARWRNRDIFDRPGDINLTRELLRLAFTIDVMHQSHYCFCHDFWVDGRTKRYCNHCQQCVDCKSWHCKDCDKCTFDRERPCTGCGGVSKLYQEKIQQGQTLTEL